jgi:hypothetical protein
METSVLGAALGRKLNGATKRNEPADAAAENSPAVENGPAKQSTRLSEKAVDLSTKLTEIKDALEQIGKVQAIVAALEIQEEAAIEIYGRNDARIVRLRTVIEGFVNNPFVAQARNVELPCDDPTCVMQYKPHTNKHPQCVHNPVKE